jgi:hypothetical protein
MIKALRLAAVAQGVLLLACASGGSKTGVHSSIDNSVVDAGAPVVDAALPDEEEEEEEEEPDPTQQKGECGDQVCNIDENCESCSPDCGRCPVCDLAPTCTGSAAIPSSAKHLEDFDNGERTLYESGVDEDAGTPLGTHFEDTDCIAPELRMRVRQINIVKDGVSGGTARVYCVVNSSDGAHSEVMITPLQPDVGDGADPLILPPEAATFWGQGKAWQTLSNLTITYQCFHAASNESYTKVFDALQDGAKEAGGVAGPWGWAFGVGSVAAGLISAAIPKGNDQPRITVQQTIDASMLLDMTNGRRWVIRGTGDGEPGNIFGGIYDWSLEVESWGCSAVRMEPAK